MNKKSQGWLATLFSWGKKRQIRESENLYAAAIAVARRPAFYQDFGVQDSVDGRFDALSLVVILVMRRLKNCGDAGKEISQQLFDSMFADMDLSLREMGAGDIGERAEQFSTLDPLLWGALLQGLSAGSAYRREVGPIVDRQAVVNFVFLAPGFPRSVKFCVREIRNELGKLSGSEEALKVVSRLSRRLNRLNKQEMTQAELHPFIDEFQVQLNNLHVAIQDTWFRVDGQ